MDDTLPFELSCARDVECDESNEGGTIFGPAGAGNFFTMSHTATRGSS